MNRNLTLEEFYYILQDAVRFSPANALNCLQINTFRALARSNAIELTSANMGATACDANTPDFYSRQWDLSNQNPNEVTTALPVLTAYELDATIEDPFSKQTEGVYSLTLAVWDALNTDKESGCEACASRPINQIFRDTKKSLMMVLRYLYSVVFATTDLDDTIRPYSEHLLKKMKQEGQIDSYTVHTHLKTRLQGENKNVRLYRDERGVEGMYGTGAVIKIKLRECFDDEYTFNQTDVKAMSHEHRTNSCC